MFNKLENKFSFPEFFGHLYWSIKLNKNMFFGLNGTFLVTLFFSPEKDSGSLNLDSGCLNIYQNWFTDRQTDGCVIFSKRKSGPVGNIKRAIDFKFH
jgi:hypothetical protein